MVGAVDTQLVKRSCRGFTLVEILLVLILIALLSTVVQSNFGKFTVTSDTLVREAYAMAARIAHGRNEALLMGKDRSFEINPSLKAVRYIALSPLAGDGYTSTTQAVVSWPEGITFAEGSTYDHTGSDTNTMTLTFKSNGTYEGPEKITITYKSGSTSEECMLLINDIGYIYNDIGDVYDTSSSN